MIDKDRCAAELAVDDRRRPARAPHRRRRASRSTSARAGSASIARLTVADALRAPRRGRVPGRQHGPEDRGAPRGSSTSGGGRARRSPTRRTSPPRSTARPGTWIVPDAEGAVGARAPGGRRVSWPVRIVPRPLRRQRAADAASRRALRGRDGDRRVRGRDGHAGEPRGARGARRAMRTPTPADVVIAVDGDGDRRRRAGRGRADARRRRRGRRRRERGRCRPPGRARSAPAARRSAARTSRSISVPGEYAALEAHRALTAGLHVFLFSDHVSVADEVALKRRGARARPARDGPGVRHGDARRRRPRLRQRRAAPARSASSPRPAPARRRRRACSTAAGGGVSQIVGVGGRDLSAEVGGLMFRQGDAAARRRRRDRDRSCWSPSRRRPRSSQALADVDCRRQAGGRRVRRLGRRRRAVRGPRRRSRPAPSPPPARPRPTSPRSSAPSTPAATPRPGARCSACSRAARSPTRR